MIPRPPTSTLFPYTTLFRSTVNGILSLKATARLECDISTKKLAIEPGAVFSGKCVMGGGVVKDLKQSMEEQGRQRVQEPDRKSTRLNSSHVRISYAVFCLKK